jgi:triosephosphate isomerase (TIM)
MTTKIRPLVAGNWKMNGTRECLTQIKAIAEGVKSPLSEKIETLLCPPITLLYVSTALADDSPLAIGAQDCHQLQNGPHTGDISAAMIADCFGTYVIVGHSERRRDHGETDDIVRVKVDAAHEADLTTIICIGETVEERTDGRTLSVLMEQLGASIPDDAPAERTVIAYEPVWAIGTGHTPTAADIETAHALIRSELVKRFGAEGQKMRILYGGSANPKNARELIGIPEVNGLLVGGASLKADDFLAIYGAYEQITA